MYLGVGFHICRDYGRGIRFSRIPYHLKDGIAQWWYLGTKRYIEACLWGVVSIDGAFFLQYVRLRYC